MVELIKGLIQVRDALTLVAFLSLVLLVAFRTPKVPELFFGLLSNKLTREQVSRLLRRFMVLGFLGFLLLVALAALAQVLNNRTQPGTVTLNDLQHELSKLQVPEENKLRAESNFGTGIELTSKQDLDRAIASLQKSLDAAPTLTAQEMLAFLLWQKGDFESANASWVAAMKLARERGDSVAQVRLDRILTAPLSKRTVETSISPLKPVPTTATPAPTPSAPSIRRMPKPISRSDNATPSKTPLESNHSRPPDVPPSFVAANASEQASVTSQVTSPGAEVCRHEEITYECNLWILCISLGVVTKYDPTRFDEFKYEKGCHEANRPIYSSYICSNTPYECGYRVGMRQGGGSYLGVSQLQESAIIGDDIRSAIKRAIPITDEMNLAWEKGLNAGNHDLHSKK